MGYQESFLYFDTQDINRNNEKILDLLALFEKYGVRCEDDILASVTSLAIFKNNWAQFKKGMHVLFITGERIQQVGDTLLDLWEDEELERFRLRYGDAKLTELAQEGMPLRTRSCLKKEELDLLDAVETAFLDDFTIRGYDAHDLFDVMNPYVQFVRLYLQKQSNAS